MVKTINQTYKEKYRHDKNRKIFTKIFLFLILLLGMLGGMVYLLFFSNLFNVREISIFSKNGSIEVRSLVENYLAEKKFLVPRFRNIFLVDSQRVTALIEEKFSSAENIKVDKKYFHGLEISLDQKEPVGVWCYEKDSQCFYFDRQGLAFDTVTETSGSLFLNINDQKGQLDKLGQPVASGDMLNLIFHIYA